MRRLLTVLWLLIWLSPAAAQVPPSVQDFETYTGLFRAVVDNEDTRLAELLAGGANPDRRDGHGRSALHVAAYFGNHRAMRRLVAAGANPNALERDFYDIVTIAAVANDLATLKLALVLGCRADNVTSRYDGTALIAAAHLGHVEVVETLIAAEAPLDHVNNLGWTAVIEAIVLGDGGERHSATLKALIDAGADINLPDARGNSPLELAQNHGYEKMVEMLRAAGAS